MLDHKRRSGRRTGVSLYLSLCCNFCVLCVCVLYCSSNSIRILYFGSIMRDRLASLIVVKQEGGNNHREAIELLQPAIKCEASLHYDSNLYHEINNNSCYRQNLNTHPQTHQSQQHLQHQPHLQQQQQLQQVQQQHSLPPPLPPLIYPCRNLFPDGCDITHLACCSSSSIASIDSPTNTTGTHSAFFANGDTCMYFFIFISFNFNFYYKFYTFFYIFFAFFYLIC